MSRGKLLRERLGGWWCKSVLTDKLDHRGAARLALALLAHPHAEVDPTMTQHPRLRAQRQTPLPLIQMRQQLIELRPQRRLNLCTSPPSTTVKQKPRHTDLFTDESYA